MTAQRFTRIGFVGICYVAHAHAAKHKPMTMIPPYDIREINVFNADPAHGSPSSSSSSSSSLFATTANLLNFVTPSKQQGRIVCGENVNPPNRYSYMVSLQNNGFHFCGGSLIEAGWVLSAAHCKDTATHVQIGRYNLEESSETYEQWEVDYEIIHPKFDSYTLQHDVMLVKLKGVSSYEPIKLDDGSDSSITANEADVTVMGWGTTSSGGFTSYTLQEVVVDVVENSICDEQYCTNTISDDMMCAARLHKDSCQGDSGGPLIHRGGGVSSDVLVGIVSWGRGCALRDIPGVYSRVSYVYDWIEESKVTQSPTFSTSPSIAPTPCPDSANATLTVSILTDSYPDETSWILKKEDNTTFDEVTYAGTEGNILHTHSYCVLSDQCYEFTLYDSYGDGFSNGAFEISYGDFNMEGDGSAFGYRTSINFCG